jgi:hypothetical protein
MVGVPRAPFQCPICHSRILFVRTSARESFPCPSCGVHLRIPASYFLLTGVISVLLSAVLLVGVGLDLFWSMIAFVPILLAVLGMRRLLFTPSKRGATE